jgi:hypothetical protein
MKASLAPIPARDLHNRLSAAGFCAKPILHGGPGEELYELAHHKDPQYVVRVHSSLRRDERAVRERGEGSVSVVALRLPPDPDVVFNGPAVKLSGTVEEVLDRVIEGAREAYAAINRRRLAAGLSAQAHEVAVRSNRADARHRE